MKLEANKNKAATPVGSGDLLGCGKPQNPSLRLNSRSDNNPSKKSPGGTNNEGWVASLHRLAENKGVRFPESDFKVSTTVYLDGYIVISPGEASSFLKAVLESLPSLDCRKLGEYLGDGNHNFSGVSSLTKKAEPPPTRDVNRDSGTASANGG